MSAGALLSEWRKKIQEEKEKKMRELGAVLSAKISQFEMRKDKLQEDFEEDKFKIEEEARKALDLLHEAEVNAEDKASTAEWNRKDEISALKKKMEEVKKKMEEVEAKKEAILNEAEASAKTKADQVFASFCDLKVSINNSAAAGG